MSSLETLSLHNNQLDALPDLSSLAQLIICRVQNNRLDFADITPHLSWLGSTPSSGDFRYSPQVVREGVRYSKSEGTDLSLSVSVSGTGNSYQWYKDAMSISGAGSDTYTIMGIQQSDAGLYHCEVTNSAVSGLTLRSLNDTLVSFIPNLESDSLALVALYDNTDGANWTFNTSWKTGSVSTWFGITLSSNGDRVSELDLSDNQLSGSIPSELGNLTSLMEELDLSDNQLTGSIPTGLGNLTSLEELYLSDNQLTGSIPVELGNLTSLTELDLSNNQLNGSIPAALGNLTSLEELYLPNNQLSGGIPAALGNLTSLEELYLSNNQLSGGIPVALGNLTSLEELYLSNNQLSGGIPSELGNLTSLEELYLPNNQLSGGIPSELGNLVSLEELDLLGNQLDALPDLSSLTQLTNFLVENNRLDFDDITPHLSWLGSTPSSGDFRYSP